MRKQLLEIIIILFVINAFPQSKTNDSLWKLFRNSKLQDTTRIKALNDIAWSYRSENPDSAIKIAELEIKFGEKVKLKKFIGKALNTIAISFKNKSDFPKALVYNYKALQIYKEIGDMEGIAKCYNNIGTVYRYQSNFSKATENYSKSLQFWEKLGDKEKTGISYGNLGIVYSDQSNYTKSIECYLKQLKLNEEIKNSEGLADSYNSIGLIYSAQKMYSKALEYLMKSLKIRMDIGEKNKIAATMINIGGIYFSQGNLDKAIENYQKSSALLEETGNKNGIGGSYLSLGAAFFAQQNYSKATEYTFKALEINKSINDIKGTSQSYANLGELYNKTTNYRLAALYCDSALKLSFEIGDIDNIRLIYKTLSNIYYNNRDYKNAFLYLEKFKGLTDSIFNIENSKQLGDIKTNFEVEKKTTEIKLKAEAEKDRIAAVTKEKEKIQLVITSSIAFGLLLVLVFSIIIYKRLQVTKKQNQIIEEQKFLVELKSKETEQQKHLIEEKHKEITDSINYAERIQKSFIATKETLDEYLKDYFVFFKPKDVVSGDFYWASKLNNNNFALVTADSTGHGVPGAIMSLLNITSLEKAIETLTEPSEILNATRKTIIERLKKDGSEHGGKDGMDASITVYDFKNKKLIISSANNPVWIVRGSEVIDIKADKMPVGKHDRDNVSFNQQEFDLQTGDVVFTLTDGFPDQFGGEKGKKFMSKNLRELLAANSHLPMHEQKELLEKTFAEWVGNLEQVDDVTLLGVRV